METNLEFQSLGGAQQVTLVGSEEWVGKGLGAVPTENAPKGV